MKGCPFYATGVVTIPTPIIVPMGGGNRCGLITGAHSPCVMGEPDWETCSRNPENNGTGTGWLIK